jgi:hypothetical protein
MYPVIMEQPSADELRAQAKYKVADYVWTVNGGPWKVIGRYWSASKGCIVYDLLYERNGVKLTRWEEHLIYPDPVSRYGPKL